MTVVRMMVAGLTMAALATQATAQAPDTQQGTGDRLIARFATCRAITAAEQRLACFDAAAASLENAVRAKDVRVVDRDDVRKARRSLFGFNLPNLDILGVGRVGRGAKDEEVFTELNTTVQSARAVGDRVEIRLADEGAPVWQVVDPMNFPPRAGAKIRIRKGALGNYFLSVDGRSYRGMRLR